MRTIIAGSRDITDMSLLEEAIKESGFEITVVLSGKARGVDRLGEQWAIKNNIKIESYPADWERYVQRWQAGLIRNLDMIDNAEAAIAVWDGQSSGTAHLIKNSKRKGLRLHVKKVKPKEPPIRTKE